MGETEFKKDSRSGIMKEKRTEYSVNEFGTQIPEATMGGGSPVFTPNDTVPVVVDPDFPSSYVFDANDLKAGKPVKIPGESAETIIKGVQDTEVEPACEVEKTTLPAAKSIEEHSMASLVKQLELMRARAELAERIKATEPGTAAVVAEPDKRIVFNFGLPFGKITTYYHNIVREDMFLVLVWDSRYKKGAKFEPSIMPEPVEVTVGSEADVHHVLSTGMAFSLSSYNLELIVLLIKDIADGDQE